MSERGLVEGEVSSGVVRRVCFFGTYTVAEGYPVNRFLMRGLRAAGVEVEECREGLWEGFLHVAFQQAQVWGLARLVFRGMCRYLRLIWRYWRAGEHQCVIVGYPGYLDIVLARLLNLCSGRELVLVSFISLYDTIVVDRQQVRSGSGKARLLRWIDRLAFVCADRVLVDTWEVGAYYAELFRLPVSKFWRSFVGHEFAGVGENGEADERLSGVSARSLNASADQQEIHREPTPPSGAGSARCRPAGDFLPGAEFRVLFFGTYVPLHGVEVILEAAAQLQGEADIEFVLIGKGQLYEGLRGWAEQRGLRQVRFIDTWMGAAELAGQVAAADLCLGIFGRTPKAARVIPYKVFGALAMRRPVITRDSPAIRELLVDGESALLCPAGDGQALAGAVRRLRDQPELAAGIAACGYAVYQERGSPQAVGQSLLQALNFRPPGLSPILR